MYERRISFKNVKVGWLFLGRRVSSREGGEWERIIGAENDQSSIHMHDIFK